MRTIFFPLLRLIGTQHWLRLGIRFRILRRFHHTLSKPFPFSVDFFGMKYKGNFASHIDRYVYLYGSYERYVLLLLRDLAATTGNGVFIDVGANVGHHTLFMTPHVNRVHAFEPYEPVRLTLESRLRENEITNVTVHPVGLGNKDGALTFNAPIGENLGVGSFSTSTERKDLLPAGELPVFMADTYLTTHEITGVSIVKIDVEGCECAVLEGMRDTLQRDRPFVVMEFSKETHDSIEGRDPFMKLFPEEYVSFTILGDVPRLGVLNHDGYRLIAFDFEDEKRNILIAPREKLSQKLLQYSA